MIVIYYDDISLYYAVQRPVNLETDHLIPGVVYYKMLYGNAFFNDNISHKGEIAGIYKLHFKMLALR